MQVVVMVGISLLEINASLCNVRKSAVCVWFCMCALKSQQ